MSWHLSSESGERRSGLKIWTFEPETIGRFVFGAGSAKRNQREARSARIQEVEDGMQRKRLTLDGIIDAVCRAYGIERDELVAPGRRRLPSKARSLIALIVQEQPNIALNEAASILHRDSSTLSAGAGRLRSEIYRDKSFRDHINDLLKRSQITISKAQSYEQRRTGR
jgi:hypothetical protein